MRLSSYSSVVRRPLRRTWSCSVWERSPFSTPALPLYMGQRGAGTICLCPCQSSNVQLTTQVSFNKAPAQQPSWFTLLRTPRDGNNRSDTKMAEPMRTANRCDFRLWGSCLGPVRVSPVWDSGSPTEQDNIGSVRWVGCDYIFSACEISEEMRARIPRPAPPPGLWPPACAYKCATHWAEVRRHKTCYWQ